ncbi:hypothetical protein M569_16391 [Genlisea aurea]|uniref:F-box domain-containing protein n=1 Tax=Genlisea aurea TaxID=192259 RepID=S8D708_9LAMI|nr:hypothetical protein M569_16391 [Genlisea aurea]
MAVEENDNGGGIQKLQERCLAEVLSFTSPKDVCRLSAVHSSFRNASSSDIIWERLLPWDYREIISRAVDDEFLERFESKRKLDRSFSLDKASGKKCFMLSARDLFIVWGNTPEYWQWIPSSTSRFAEVAELLSVCWLELWVDFDLNLLSKHTTYGAYLVFNINCGAYGFDHHPIEVCVENSEYKCKRSIWLNPNERRRQRPRRRNFFRAPVVVAEGDDEGSSGNDKKGGENVRERGDGWMEVELGEVYVDDDDDGNLEMSLTEVKGGNWKGGLLIQGIEFRPKD